MENTEILKELDTLKTELNGCIDSVIKKYEDSIKHPLYSWVEIISGGNGALGSNSLIGQVVTMSDIDKTTGGNPNENYPKIRCINGVNWQLCNRYKLRLLTTQEVEDALTKEAVKRLKGKKFTDARGHGNKYNYDKDFEKFYYKDGILCIQSNWNGTVFYNGTWAEIISEPKTIDELSNDMYQLNHYHLSKYLKENKSEIIETLKNL